jgi:hypothetical protein
MQKINLDFHHFLMSKLKNAIDCIIQQSNN